jgi:hypothetical protein
LTSDHVGYPNSGSVNVDCSRCSKGHPAGWGGSPATELEWSEVTSNQIKFVSATIGASAVIAMGAFAVASSDTRSAEPPTPGPVTTSEVTTGETITETVLPEAPETSVVVPPITTTPSTIPPTAETH